MLALAAYEEPLINPLGYMRVQRRMGHAEWRTFWEVYESIPRGMEGGTLLIDYVIAYSPCGGCQESTPDMNRMVRSRAGPNVDITIRWWYLSSKGEVRPWPKTP